MSYNDVPEPTLLQKFKLVITKKAFLRYEQHPGWRKPLPIYIVKCTQHGLYLDWPHGFNRRFHCDACLAERHLKRCMAVHV